MKFFHALMIDGIPGTIQPLHRAVSGLHHWGGVTPIADGFGTLSVGRAGIRNRRPRWVGRPTGVLDLAGATILPQIPGPDLGVGPRGGTESIGNRLADRMRWTRFVVEGAGSHGVEIKRPHEHRFRPGKASQAGFRAEEAWAVMMMLLAVLAVVEEESLRGGMPWGGLEGSRAGRPGSPPSQPKGGNPSQTPQPSLDGGTSTRALRGRPGGPPLGRQPRQEESTQRDLARRRPGLRAAMSPSLHQPTDVLRHLDAEQVALGQQQAFAGLQRLHVDRCRSAH